MCTEQSKAVNPARIGLACPCNNSVQVILVRRLENEELRLDMEQRRCGLFWIREGIIVYSMMA